MTRATLMRNITIVCILAYATSFNNLGEYYIIQVFDSVKIFFPTIPHSSRLWFIKQAFLKMLDSLACEGINLACKYFDR